jgi:hypothetical protein
MSWMGAEARDVGAARCCVTRYHVRDSGGEGNAVLEADQQAIQKGPMNDDRR